MMLNLIKRLFDSNDSQLRKIQPIIDQVNDMEAWTKSLSDDELAQKSIELRKRIGVDVDALPYGREDFDVADQFEKLQEILPEAFALAREAASRVAGHRHFDVQLMAGYFLANSKVIELFTGEGKTNSANLALYLFGLTGRGAHLVTVNDYLARRDGEWNGHVLNALGLSVGVINSGTQYKFISDEDVIELKGEDGKKVIQARKDKVAEVGRLKLDMMEGVNLVECSKLETYNCDVVYGTNNEFGFDYLRDNMSQNVEDLVQRRLHYAIIDEADSILIDEARTPLIISQSAQASNDMYKKFATLVKGLKMGADYEVDEKSNSVSITDQGIDSVEKSLSVKNVYEDASFAYHLENALKAKELYKLDDEYIISNGEILIVDEFTGRAMDGRRYSEGLHQAIEAKEGVEVKRESKTLATVTLQNYFRLYDYLAGMTATALTEAEEFAKIYKLDVIVVPTNKQVVRVDHNDVVYRSQEGKFQAIVQDIQEHNAKGQPILVGTASVERSEYLSTLLTKAGIKHSVLNAKQHEREAKIVQDAGQKGQVTIATNMAGRGTDIALGGGVVDLGGLYVIGSERHESRRIDNQLRGRSGRQGDPGESRFFVSFEDELMRKFGGDRAQGLLEKVGMEDDMPISIGILGRTIENAQKKVEAYNFDIRKRLVEYDDVLNQQREIIYSLRRNILGIIDEQQDGTEAVKVDLNGLKELDVDRITDALDKFTLRDRSSFDFEQFGKFAPLLSPVNVWILKRFVGHMKLLLAAQLQDDMAMDSTEERSVYAQVQNILGKELIDEVEQYIDLDGAESVERLFEDEDGDMVVKQNTVIRLTVFAFIFRLMELGASAVDQMSKVLILQSIDKYWMEHLDAMGDLREGVGMRSVAQLDPLVEYKNEGFMLFEKMLSAINTAVVNRFFKVRVVRAEQSDLTQLDTSHSSENVLSGSSNNQDRRPGETGGDRKPIINTAAHIGRNDPCPCGSGKKYKKCHIGKGPQSDAERKAFALYANDRAAWEKQYAK